MLSRPRLIVQLVIIGSFVILLSALAGFLTIEGFRLLNRERLSADRTELTVIDSKHINTGGRRRKTATITVAAIGKSERSRKIAIIGLNPDSRFYVRSTAEDGLAQSAAGEYLPAYRAYKSVIGHSIMVWTAAIFLIAIIIYIGRFGVGTWRALLVPPYYKLL